MELIVNPDRYARQGTADRSPQNCGDDGAGGRTRTDDLLITNQLLYQLSYAGRLGGCPGDAHVNQDESSL